MKRPFLTFSLIAAMTVACTVSTDRIQTFTAGAIGCPPREITISDVHGSVDYPRAWQAQCRGRAFECSISASVQCAPMLAVPGIAAAEADAGSDIDAEATPIVIGVEPPPDAGPTTSATTAPPPSPKVPDPAPPIDRDTACKAAQDYDRRAAAANEPAKTQLRKIAARKHKECESGELSR